MSHLLRGWTPRERVVVLALAVYVTVAAVVLIPVRGAVGGPSAAGPPPAPIAADDDPVERVLPGVGTTPELAASQKLRADQLLGADKALATALGGTPYTIEESGPWTTSGANGAPSRVLGAAYIVTPNQPVTLRGVSLPGALYDQTEVSNPPYQPVVNTVSATNVNQLLVLVDLTKGQVVSIVPGPDAEGVESTPPTGFQRRVPVPTEGGS